MLTASAPTLRLLLDEAERRGVKTDGLLQDVGITRQQLAEPAGRVGDDALRRCMALLLERVDDPAFGFAAVRELAPGTFGSLGYAFRNSETLGDGFRRLSRYARLLHEAAHVELQVGAERAQLSIRFDDPVPLPRALQRMRAQMWLAPLVRIGRKITGTQLQPLSVSFPFPEPRDLSPYRELVDCPLVFGAPCAALTLSLETLALPVVDPDRNLAGVMERYASGLLEQLPEHSDIDLRVRQATCRAVQAGEPRLERVARELGMSARSLQRKLQAAEISFSRVLDEVRRELALAYLDEADMSVDQVAGVLGFASGSSFAKAFRRWTGKAPGSYRSGAQA